MSQADQNRTQARELSRLRQLVTLAPNDPDLRLDLAEVLLQHGFHEDAAVQVRAAIALAPNHLEARKLLDRALAGLSPPS